MKKKIDIDTLMKLFHLFADKKWTEFENYKDVLDRFAQILKNLKPNQSELILELTERYIWQSFNEYHSNLVKLFKSLHETHLENKTKIYIFPVKKLVDEEETKSGDVVQYTLKGILPLMSKYDNIEKIPLKKFEEISEENLKLEDDEFIVFVDDFIGSGNTLDETLGKIEENETFENKFAILTSVIQEETRNNLENNGTSLFYAKSVKKGITNYYENEELDLKISIMEDIEKRIPNISGYKFGYEKSEGLVTLLRTPNNTFPIFWMDFQPSKEKIKAPFSRY